MKKEQRKKFETHLIFTLKKFFGDKKEIKILKTGISVKNEQGEAKLNWRFLNNANGYSLSVSVVHNKLKQFIESTPPPYPPNNHGDCELVMNTSMEKSNFRQLSREGVVLLPSNDVEIEQVSEYMCKRIEDIYLPRALSLLENKTETIDDVKTFPQYYKYPISTIVFIAKQNGLKINDFNFDELLSKKISGNRNFDRMLIENFL